MKDGLMKAAIATALALLFGPFIKPATRQTQDPNANSASSKPRANDKSVTTPAPQKTFDAGHKPKKIWTNDDVGSLKGGVSVVGGKTKTPVATAMTDDREEGENDLHAARVQQYRDAIEQCHSQIDQVDARIAQLKDFKGENTSPNGGINPNSKYNMVPPEGQVKQLEAKKKELEGKIGDLENQARKEGIDPGELR
jgi:hypothetical protein